MAAAKTAIPATPDPATPDPATPDPAEAAPPAAPVDGPICDVDWPDGWPAGADMASCEHGLWTRIS